MKLFFLLMIFIVHVSQTSASKLQGFTEDLPPYQYTLENGSLSGYTVELMHCLAYLAEGKSLSVHSRSWSAAFRTVLENKNTVLFSTSRTKEREGLFIWGGALVTENTYAWSLDPKLKVGDVESLRAYPISLTRSSSSDYYFSDRKFPNIVRVDQQEQNMKMLLRQRVKLIIGTPQVIRLRAEKMGIDRALLKRVILLPELSQNLYFAFNKDTDRELIKRYMSAYESIKKTGKMDRLQEKWLF